MTVLYPCRIECRRRRPGAFSVSPLQARKVCRQAGIRGIIEAHIATLEDLMDDLEHLIQ